MNLQQKKLEGRTFNIKEFELIGSQDRAHAHEIHIHGFPRVPCSDMSKYFVIKDEVRKLFLSSQFNLHQ